MSGKNLKEQGGIQPGYSLINELSGPTIHTYLQAAEKSFRKSPLKKTALGIKRGLRAIRGKSMVSELSTRLLNRYAIKASKEWKANKDAAKLVGGASQKAGGLYRSGADPFQEKMFKRDMGIRKAEDIIAKRNDYRKTLMKDDVNVLDETSKMRLFGYLSKRYLDTAKKIDTVQELDRIQRTKLGVSFPTLDDMARQALKQSMGVRTAVERLKGAKPGTIQKKIMDREFTLAPSVTPAYKKKKKLGEGYEHLSEISTKLLRAYHKKSMQAISDYDLLRKARWVKPDEQHILAKMERNRAVGVIRARARLKKRGMHIEEAQALNEISAKLAARYLARRGAIFVDSKKGQVKFPSDQMQYLEKNAAQARYRALKRGHATTFEKDTIRVHNKTVRATNHAMRKLFDKASEKTQTASDAHNRVRDMLVSAEKERLDHALLVGRTPTIKMQVKKFAKKPTTPPDNVIDRRDQFKSVGKKRERIDPKMPPIDHVVDGVPPQHHLISNEGRVLHSGTRDRVYSHWKKLTGGRKSGTGEAKVIISNHPKVREGIKLSREEIKALEKISKKHERGNFNESTLNETSKMKALKYIVKARMDLRKLDKEVTPYLLRHKAGFMVPETEANRVMRKNANRIVGVHVASHRIAGAKPGAILNKVNDRKSFQDFGTRMNDMIKKGENIYNEGYRWRDLRMLYKAGKLIFGTSRNHKFTNHNHGKVLHNVRRSTAQVMPPDRKPPILKLLGKKKK